MNTEALAHFEDRSIIFKALAHPARLLIIDALARQKHCVCELTDMIGADTSTVSKHLSVLRNAGIVEDEKQGQMVYYTLAMPCVLTFLSCIDSVLLERARSQIALSSHQHGNIHKNKGMHK